MLTATPYSDVDERPPICPVCGVTMVPVELSARESALVNGS
jgi:hypothetical protein